MNFVKRLCSTAGKMRASISKIDRLILPVEGRSKLNQQLIEPMLAVCLEMRRPNDPRKSVCGTQIAGKIARPSKLTLINVCA